MSEEQSSIIRPGLRKAIIYVKSLLIRFSFVYNWQIKYFRGVPLRYSDMQEFWDENSLGWRSRVIFTAKPSAILKNSPIFCTWESQIAEARMEYLYGLSYVQILSIIITPKLTSKIAASKALVWVIHSATMPKISNRSVFDVVVHSNKITGPWWRIY